MALGRALAAALALSLALLGPLSPGARAGDCKGQRQVLREAPGFVTDGAGNYSVNGNCEWLIEGEWGRVGHTPTRSLIRLCTHSSTHHIPRAWFWSRPFALKSSQPGPCPGRP